MLLIDLGNSFDEPLEESQILLKNLLQFSGIYANWETNLGKSPEELIGPVEVEWTRKLEEIFHNAKKEKNTQDMPPLLKQVMSKFNAQHEFKVYKYLELLNLWYIKHISVLLWK